MRGWPKAATPALVALALVALGGAQASADVLYDQTLGAGANGVPSQESLDDPAATTRAADDFVVPYGQHWALSGVEMPGSSSSGSARPFNVSLHEEFGATRLGPGRELFSARGLAATGAPHYTVPIQGAPLLNPGSYWVSAQAVGSAADPWLWSPQPTLRGRPAIWQNVGNGLGTDCTEWWPRDSCLALPVDEPDQAFRLLGSYKQVLTSGWFGNTGRVVSSPPGIDCPGACSAAFDRGTVVTLTGIPLRPSMEFTGWRRGIGPPPALGPPPVALPPTDLPCPDPGKGPCQLTLNEDFTIYGTYELSNEVRFGKLKRNLRDGSAKLFLGLRAGGALSMTSRAVRAFRESEAKPGTVRLPLIPKGAAKRRLERTGKARVALRIKFRASGNNAETTVRHLTLRQKLAP
ncbi:MAG: hypothetical protein WA862_13290 [Solirubrobacterales bacterium]